MLALVKDCQDVEELRARVLDRMELSGRTRTELWYASGTRKHPSEWVRYTFREVNNGRVTDIPLPKTISLIVPDFDKDYGEFEITAIDTKGVDDIVVREDMDLRLRDPRTSVVLCSGFNDAPDGCSQQILRHMKQSFPQRIDNGKVSMLCLPRPGEARKLNDDLGNPVESDDEGYELKRIEINGKLQADDLPGVETIFLNAVDDDAQEVRKQLLTQLSRMRIEIGETVLELCHAAEEIIQNRERHAVTAAIKEVAKQLNTFLRGNGKLGTRERHAYQKALATVSHIRYAATLWASTRRNGEYYNLNILHQIGVGAREDALLRSRAWYHKIEGLVNTLKADADLGELAKHSIEQIRAVAAASRREFLEAAQRSATEIYREPLSHADMWTRCAREWGRGRGFKYRVRKHLYNWFENEGANLKNVLDDRLEALWIRIVIEPLTQLTEEHEPESGSDSDSTNIVHFPSVESA